MTPTVNILVGDVREVLRSVPSCSVHCCVSSPPYFALRSYLPADHPAKSLEIGSEPTPEAFIATMVAVYREVRRVLRDDGVIFVNLGDSYATGGGKCNNPGGDTRVGEDGFLSRGATPANRLIKGIDGQLLNIPHRVAEALRADGWIWRQTIIWAKRSPMPESVSGWRWVRCRVKVARARQTRVKGFRALEIGASSGSDNSDMAATWSPCPGCSKCEPHGGWVLRRGKGRCTNAHEFIFVMSKAPWYFWDSAASKEAATLHADCRATTLGCGSLPAAVRVPRNNDSFSASVRHVVTERNPRTVWTISSEPTSEKHFATFPSELVRRCLVAGVSAGGCCPTCGAPWAPMIETERVATRPGTNSKVSRASVHADSPYHDHAGVICGNRDPQRHNTQSSCPGYRATCDCPAHEPAPCTVLDPFSGLGTTGQTARHLGHNYIGCELNPEYAALSRTRIDQPPRWWLRLQAAKPVADALPNQRTLFEEVEP